MRIHRIVSGGQTGADRAGLDAAIAVGRSYAGWCVADGLAEDLPTPPGLLARYPALTESSADPAVRTRLNVRDSHATLVLRDPSTVSPGTDLTVAVALELDRPWLQSTDAEEITAWVATLGHELTLNVAGPRESEQPGLYRAAHALLVEVLRHDR